MKSSNVPSKPASLKLPAAPKTQLERDAHKAGLSPHAFMVQTLADSVRRTRLRDAFSQARRSCSNPDGLIACLVYF